MESVVETDYQPVTLEAHQLVFGARVGSYGHPLDDFTCTAAFWTAWLRHRGLLPEDVGIEAEDVGPMMMLLKLSRQANAHGRDNLVDACGYAETTLRVIHERGARTAREERLIALLEEHRTARELGLVPADLAPVAEPPLLADEDAPGGRIWFGGSSGTVKRVEDLQERFYPTNGKSG